MTKPVEGSEPVAVVRAPNGHFLPGQSGNPTGRPALIKKMQELAREQTEDAINTLVACLKDEDGRVRVSAAVALLDRGYGRPAQSITTEDGGALMAGLVVLPPMDPDA
jgi:hypothetical protein